MAYAYIVGVDIFLENLKFCKKYGAYDDLVLADIKNLPFKKGCFDITLACEVIEHIEKKEGGDFLLRLGSIARRRVIVTTPNGSWPENPVVYKNGTVNVYERHKSMWCTNDFVKRGYAVHAIGLRVKLTFGKGLAGQLSAGIDFLLFPAWFLPQIGKHLVAYKDVAET
jgi:hypothetical protein